MRALAIGGCLVLAAGCGTNEEPPAERDAWAAAATLEKTAAEAGAAPEAETDAPPPGAAQLSSEAGASACPNDMVLVDTTYCADVERRCVDMEHEPINHLAICHAFAPGEQKCRTAERRIAFCVDRYEYPNQKGAHPVWMLDWSEAQATCESKGKRLCWQSEWTAACEGPEHTPFPYGWERDHTQCNVDNFYIDPMKYGPKGQFFFYSKDKDVQTKELARLDQSVPSGSMETCKSGFGVYDMPGNLDEWVVSDQPPREVSKWTGLKGGAWGHVRSQCRPTTYSHEPGFAYYFVGFRCCRDADGVPPEARWTPSPQAIPAPKVEPHDFAPDPIVAAGAPGPSKAKFTRSGHKE
jgi:hypothetical protein